MTIEEELALIHGNPTAVPGTSPAAETAPSVDPAPTTIAATATALGDAGVVAADTAEVDAYPDIPTGAPPLPRVGAGSWDVFAASWAKRAIETDAWGAERRARTNLAWEMINKLPSDVQDKLLRFDFSRNDLALETLVMPEVVKAAAENPKDWVNFPLSAETFTQRINAEQKADIEEYQKIQDQPGGGVAEFLGEAGSEVFRPINMITAPIIGPTGSLWKVLASEFAIGAASSALAYPEEAATATRLDLPEPDFWSSVLLGGGAQAGLTGAVRGLAKLAALGAVKHRAAKEITPDGGDSISSGIEVDKAEARMRGDQTVQEQRADDGTLPSITANRIPEVSADAPENWGQIRNGIFAGESGGDYNALFGFQNRKGGKFSRVKLTAMTVDQAIAFSDPKGPYGQWVKGKIGRVATPMGAYQIVGTTLRAAKRALGLAGDELMTPELQERLGHWIYRSQGTGAWEGYKGPRDSFTPSGADRDAPTYGDTSRGYTGEGQVTAGDNTKIDVEYVVVDIDSLTRASGDLQPRDRSRGNSDAWIADTAARLDPRLLMPSPTADKGPPIVGPDSMIESGNGRTMAIERAYERHPDRAAAYRTQIEAAGYAVPGGVKRPVLVARRKTDLTADQRRQFVIDAQDSGVAVMTPTEIARTSSRAMTAPVLGRLDPSQALTAEANGDFVRAALAGLPRSARNAMFDAGGMLNASGQRQLREAMFARAWNDPDIIEMFTEADQGELKSLMEALATAAPNWAALKADIEAGLVRPEMDISGHVLDAMRLIASARKLASRDGLSIGKALAELLDDVDLMEGAVAPLTTALVRKFWKNGRAASADDVAGFLARYADDARKAGSTADMFGAASPRDVLRGIDAKAFDDLPEDLGPVRGFATKANTTPANLSDQGYEAGAVSAEAEATDLVVRDSLQQPQVDEETEALKADLADARDGILADFMDIQMTLGDGTQLRTRDMLSELDRDAKSIDTLNGCAISQGGE